MTKRIVKDLEWRRERERMSAGSTAVERLSKSSYISELHFFTIIHVGDSGFALADVVVVVDVVGQRAVLCRGLKMTLSKGFVILKGGLS